MYYLWTFVGQALGNGTISCQSLKQNETVTMYFLYIIIIIFCYFTFIYYLSYYLFIIAGPFC